MKKEKIQTEVKNKPSVLTKILSIVMLSVIIIFATSSLVLSVSPKDYNFGFSNPDSIRIHTKNDSINDSVWEQNDANGVYNKIMELYNNSFKSTALNSLFKGVLFENVKPQEGTDYFSSMENKDYIEFRYNQQQTLKVNNAVYEPSKSSIDNKYYRVIIKIENKESLSKVTAYICYNNDFSRIKLNSYAVQNELYDYIKSL